MWHLAEIWTYTATSVDFVLHCKSDLSVLKDYPSIAHLVQKLSDNNIQTIFAVTEEFQPVYQVSSLLLSI